MRRSLDRLSEQKRLVSIFNGYYLVIPPAYRSKGVLPPALFIDGLMNHLQRPYYVAALNAAAYYGAAHQQPQNFFVVTNFPVLRPIEKKGLKIEFISRETIPDWTFEKRKTESGYFNVSTPEQTAADLIHYEKRIGGLSRAASVISDLVDQLFETCQQNNRLFYPVLLQANGNKTSDLKNKRWKLTINATIEVDVCKT